MFGSTMLLSSILFTIGPVFVDYPHIFFLASCEGVLNGNICSYNGARREHAAENILGGSQLDHRIAGAYFTLMLIDILFYREYEASSIYSWSIYTKQGLPDVRRLRSLFQWPLSSLEFSHGI